MSETPRKKHSRALRRALFTYAGPALLVLLIILIARSQEPQQFLALLRRMQPFWLVAALVLQALTYFAHALVWRLALSRVKERVPLPRLAAFSLSQQFINQALPTGGLSGSAAVAGYLRLRGVSHRAVALALGLNLLALYLAHLFGVLAAVGIVSANHLLDGALVALASLVAVVVLVVLAGALYLWRRASRGRVPAFLKRFPATAEFFASIRDLPRGALLAAGALLPATALLVVIFALDSLTLAAVLYAFSTPLPFSAVFAADVMSSAAALVSPIPGGLGVFEGGMTFMLNLFGLPLAGALAAAVLLRGFTYWLPMIPGYLITRHEMRRARAAQAAS